MAVSPTDNIRVIVRQVGTGDTLYANTFYTKISGGPSLSDFTVLNDMEDYVESMYTVLAAFVDNELVTGSCQVDLVEVEGVYDPDPDLNEAKVVVVRPLGFINPVIPHGGTGEEYDAICTGSIVPKTFVSGPRPRKSLSGFTESQISQKIFVNSALAAMTTFALNWLVNIPAPYLAGTLSLVDGLFKTFDGSFSIKNSGGTMVTRKIGRGA